MLNAAIGCLRLHEEEHREMLKKITKKVDEVARPWSVKCKSVCLPAFSEPEARAALPPCKEIIRIKNPFCGHDIDVACSDRDVQDWKPWDEQTAESVGRHFLSQSAILQLRPPEHLERSVRQCRSSITFARTCGHETAETCKAVMELFLDAKPLDKCASGVVVRLHCEHDMEVPCWKQAKLANGQADVRCDALKHVPCWNKAACGLLLPVKCGVQSLVSCDSVSTWKCSAETAHTFELKQCVKGVPEACPGCSGDGLEKDLRAAEGVSFELHRALPTWLQGHQVAACKLDAEVISRFNDGLVTLLSSFKSKQESLPVWERQLYRPYYHPCFIRLNKNTDGASSFSPRDFCKAATHCGIEVHDWTAQNVMSVAKDTSEGKLATLLTGYCFSLQCSINPAIPKGKRRQATIRELQQQGFHAAYFDKKDRKSLVFWDPFPLYATHRVTLSKGELEGIAEQLGTSDSAKLEPTKVSFRRAQGSILVVSSSSAQSSASGPASGAHWQTKLQATRAHNLRFDTKWDWKRLSHAPARLPPSLDKELIQTLEFINSAAPMFAGKRLLDGRLERESPPILLHLLLSLELLALEEDPTISQKHLESYLGALGPDAHVHPLVLLAMARLSSEPQASETLVSVFCGMGGEAAEPWLTDEERQRRGEANGDEDGEEDPPSTEEEEVRSGWEKLKAAYACSSKAMEELLALTGLLRVKKDALRLFQSGVKFAQLLPEAREANAPALNYCFLGNPGTGKTTVGKLFARILHDSGLRQKSSFNEVTAQKLKDGGTDELRKLAQLSSGGVLFIDEAYELDPNGDYQGKPIVAELLTLSEEQRESLSIILAGYEDEMQTKLFESNPGLKSRFKEVTFDDFDKQELTEIWQYMLAKRKWSEPAEPITQAALRRLLSKSKRKGFGNARDVRQMVESAANAAMARDDFDSMCMELHICDVIGEDPLKNVKIQAIIDELEAKVGWNAIKREVRGMIQLCSANHVRETQGLEPNPVTLNRLFLGNPGTGKTTCAGIYGRLLKQLGFLSDGSVILKTTGDFGGSVVGEAQKKAIGILQGAQGKVLVIDEAYGLAGDQYGKQVLNTLVEKVSGSADDDIAVLLLGYEEPMMKMIGDENPGLASRFPRESAFVFEDYHDRELLQIIKSVCKSKQARSTIDFQQKAIRVLQKQKQLGNFGNARAVETLVRDALQKATQRSPGNHRHLCLEVEDVEGLDQQEGDPLSRLAELYRMESVKAQLQKMIDAHAVAEKEGDEIPHTGHFVFTGAPGTGKTTVARMIAEILYSLGMIIKDICVETSGLDLTGEYLGQTKKKVEEQLKKAKGGVLFIDEAYELGKGQFGSEALTAIVAAMTNPEYAGIVFIIAGYQDDIDKMLDVNAGLKSRFTQFLHFPDWETDDCMTFLTSKAEKAHVQLEAAGLGVLRRGFEELIALAGWGNARDVDKLWKAMMMARAGRVRQEPEEERFLTAVDISSAVGGVLENRRSQRGIGPRCEPNLDVSVSAAGDTHDCRPPRQPHRTQAADPIGQPSFQPAVDSDCWKALADEIVFLLERQTLDRQGADDQDVACGEEGDPVARDPPRRTAEACPDTQTADSNDARCMEMEAREVDTGENSAEVEAQSAQQHETATAEYEASEQGADAACEASCLSHAAAGKPLPDAGTDERDEGVSDEVWEELQESKRRERDRRAEWEHHVQELARAEEEARQCEDQLRREHEAEQERIREEAEQRREEALRRVEEVQRAEEMRRAEERRVEALQRAEEARRARERELEEQRRVREEARRKREEEERNAEALQQKLRQLRPCPAGFAWYQQGGGWRCGGGSHFVSDEELRRSFSN